MSVKAFGCGLSVGQKMGLSVFDNEITFKLLQAGTQGAGGNHDMDDVLSVGMTEYNGEGEEGDNSMLTTDVDA